MKVKIGQKMAQFSEYLKNSVIFEIQSEIVLIRFVLRSNPRYGLLGLF